MDLPILDVMKSALSGNVNDPDRRRTSKESIMNGIITRVVVQKGFGFVTGEDKQDYFFHRTDFNGFFEDLIVDVEKKRAIKVTFEPASTDKGPRARNVTRADNGV